MTESTNDDVTELTSADLEKVFDHLLNFEMKKQLCLKCSKDFWPNYHSCMCDECYFSFFKKEDVQAFYRSLLE